MKPNQILLSLLFIVMQVILSSGKLFSDSILEFMPVADAHVDMMRPDIQTHVDFPDPTDRIQASRLMVRTNLGHGEDSRLWITYLKFDLSILTTPPTDVALFLSRIPQSGLWGDGQIKIYGLPSLPDNTPQDWSEETLTFNSTGDELIKPISGETSPIDENNLVFLGNLPAADEESLDTLFLDERLDAFIAEIFSSQKEVTLIVFNSFNTNRNVIFNSSRAYEVETAPRLLVPKESMVDQVTLQADADTWVRIDKTVGEPRDEIIANLTYGSSETLSFRSLDQGANPGNFVREHVTYIRFDLSQIEGVIAGGSEFFVVADGAVGFSSTQVQLYGLIESDGFTPQDWDEATLNWNTVGGEIMQDMLGGFTAIDDIRLDLPFLSYTPYSRDLLLPSGLIPITFSNAKIDAFLRERQNAGVIKSAGSKLRKSWSFLCFLVYKRAAL